MALKEIGWDEWFEGNSECVCAQELERARVTVVDRDRYLVINGCEEFSAKLSGKFLYSAMNEDEYPCVGDWVCIQRHDNESTATIHNVLPRKSFLRRKSPGKDIDYQMIGANIDVALIIQSCHFDFNLRRLERYLVMVNEGDVEPWVILTKVDLINPDEVEQLVAKIRDMGVGAKIVTISNVTGVGIQELRNSMVPGKTYCLTGSSGVGKSTLINTLVGHSELETKTVSATGEGRHTTVRRQLIVLDQGAMLIDTPGMRELGILGASQGVDESYSDIVVLAGDCRFKDCSHTNEPGCAVIKALDDGSLNREHYQNYLKIKKESEFYEMSYVEKRKKDKEFGKHIHSVIKDKSRYK